MIVSEKRATAIYNAISNPIQDLRIENSAGFSIEEMDEKLFKLEQEIFKKLSIALDLTYNKK